MFAERETTRAESISQERRELGRDDPRILGYVVTCDGARATLAATAMPNLPETAGLWTVGRLISINLGGIRTVGLVYEIHKFDRHWTAEEENAIEVKVELVGEVRDGEAGSLPTFDRGITQYPHIGAIAHRIRARDLQAVYDLGGRNSVRIGHLAQESSIEANVAIDDTLSRHFAFVGTTGVGKSTAVTHLLRRAIEAKPELTVLILDPHNEFASAFGQKARRIDMATLDLPFWIFRLEEFAEVLFRGREVISEEVDVLRDLIPIAKQSFRGGGGALVRRQSSAEGITADTPVPYRMADLLKLIDERMGLLDSKPDRPIYRMLRIRIESALSDPRYAFMFGSKLIEDTIHETISQIFRIPHHGKPITCFEMAGLPSEVVNAVCSVLARLSFDLTLSSDGNLKLLLVCEEAHRYLPSDPRLGFAPTRYALSRIAKEGRKYGCYLGIITQRPGELDPTILSQCSTVFSMRLANEQDQAIVRSAIADSSASSLSFLSSMGQREAIAFGEGVATTMRLKFENLPKHLIPGLGKGHGPFEPASSDPTVDLVSIVNRMRGGQSAQRAATDAALHTLERAVYVQEQTPKRDEAPKQRFEDDLNFGYGLKPGGKFGNRG
jgi:DNA helicase HerA-like ATPase